jgi:hypothetical protein
MSRVASHSSQAAISDGVLVVGRNAAVIERFVVDTSFTIWISSQSAIVHLTSCAPRSSRSAEGG